MTPRGAPRYRPIFSTDKNAPFPLIVKGGDENMATKTQREGMMSRERVSCSAVSGRVCLRIESLHCVHSFVSAKKRDQRVFGAPEMTRK